MNSTSTLPEELARPVSVENLRTAFGIGTPTAVYNVLVPFLRQESKSNGDTRVINEISESVSKLVGGWLQTSEAMHGDEQRMLYALLRPGGHLVDTLLQYHVLQRQRSAAAIGPAALLTIPLHSLPIEYHVAPNADIARATRLPADISRRVAAGTGFTADALEYFIYHVVKALAPMQDGPARSVGRPVTYTPKSPGTARPGPSASGSVAYWLAREYIGFFMPVAVPEKLPPVRSDPNADRSPMKHIRERLHDLSPAKVLSGAADHRDRRPGAIDTDLLDMCEYTQALELASFFVACAVVQWVPAVPMNVLAAVRKPSATSGKDEWVWMPKPSQLSALHLFHVLVGYMAKGERQMERYHLTGDTGHIGEGPGAAASEIDAYTKRVSMNGTVRDTLRARILTAAVGDTLGLVLASCARTDVSDSEIWIPFLDVTVSVWIRYVMPWRGSKADPASASADISPLWQSRIPLMMKGLPPALYGQTLALFIRQISSPNVDLLAHTTSVLRNPSAGAGHGVQTWIHDAVSSVFGHPFTVDVLAVIDRVVSAFAAPDLRSILAAVERCQIDAFPRLREQAAKPTPQLSTPGFSGNLALQTPTKKAAAAARRPENAAENAAFEMQIAVAQKLLQPYVQEIAACRSGSPILDSAMGVLGQPPVSLVFRPEPSPLLSDAVRALHSAEVLAERQLRLIVPEGSADQARSVVSDIFLVISRLFAASDDSPPWGSGDYSGMSSSASETMRARAQSLHEAQTRIRTLYVRLAVVFHATRKDIDSIKEIQDDAAISAAGMHTTNGLQPFGSSTSFGERLAARGRQADVATPEMEHGSLTPRGRWELKTGRKKFTAQSLLASPQQSQSSSPPQWHLHARRAAPVADESLQPRGPRAQLQARSYESQWLLDHIRVFNVVANRRYQQLLDLVDAGVFPVTSSMRAYELDFRWAAAYPNLRFLALVLVVLRIVFWIF
ncbi:hypothetical protein IWW50_003690 [Coemansia erecta]|nr:hypothetical protein GGF43_000979 [Coemansia sp. RSA 2618]KAJ2823644.1 hypothetical protein IWW50_003690 [Coemansia erecta]